MLERERLIRELEWDPTSVYRLDLPLKRCNALYDAGFRTIEEVRRASRRRLWKVPGIGRQTLQQIESALRDRTC